MITLLNCSGLLHHHFQFSHLLYYLCINIKSFDLSLKSSIMSQEARNLIVQYLAGQNQQPGQAIEEFCRLNSSGSPPSNAAPADAEAAFAQLKSNIRNVFGLIKLNNLALAGTELIQITRWVKTNAVNLSMSPYALLLPCVSHFPALSSTQLLTDFLGLCNDDPNPAKREEKIYVWELFNFCWLAALQKQKELSTSGGPGLLDASTLKNMGHEVISCGNGLERFGLVDYQQGLWESKIIDGKLDKCRPAPLHCRMPWC